MKYLFKLTIYVFTFLIFILTNLSIFIWYLNFEHLISYKKVDKEVNEFFKNDATYY